MFLELWTTNIGKELTNLKNDNENKNNENIKENIIQSNAFKNVP